MTGKCCQCGRKVFSRNSIYCRTCSHFSARMSDERFPPKTRNAFWKTVRRNVRKYGPKKAYVCEYTGQELDVFNESDPYFLEFDHVVPGDPSRIVMTSAWFNELKGDLALKELKGSVDQLYNHWHKGTKIKRKKFRYWYRLLQLREKDKKGKK